MVRLVFRPYTQIRRTICTSVSLRASTRVSPGFTLFRHRSPSFGSQQICSYSNLSVNTRSVDNAPHPKARFLPQRHKPPLLSLRIRVYHPNTRIYVRLLGPCFKTGQLRPFCQDLDCTWTLLNHNPRLLGTACSAPEDGRLIKRRPAIERAINPQCKPRRS